MKFLCYNILMAVVMVLAILHWTSICFENTFKIIISLFNIEAGIIKELFKQGPSTFEDTVTPHYV